MDWRIVYKFSLIGASVVKAKTREEALKKFADLKDDSLLKNCETSSKKVIDCVHDQSKRGPKPIDDDPPWYQEIPTKL